VKLRVVEIQANIMRKNDALAAALRARFAKSGTLVVNLLSSPGSGKTTLLEETLRDGIESERSSAIRPPRTTPYD
jgi:hydrogenase nickel incorporation protein HypB